MDEAYPVSEDQLFSGEAELPGFGDSFAEKVEDFGSPAPAPPVKKERRYSGMEIPFGVIETGTNVNELNPMILGNSKRMSMLTPEKQHDDVDFGTERMSIAVDEINPLRKNSGKFMPTLVPLKPHANDEIPFGVEERAAGVNHTNPMRLSGKFTRTPSGSPVKPAQEPVKMETTTTTSASSTDHDRRREQATALVASISSALRIVFLFVYILFEIVYELAMDAIKPPSQR